MVALEPVYRDRLLPCRRCGLRFLWTAWEQQQDPTEPSHCPGCRHLLALTPRYGSLKWYDRRKGFGFITMADGSEVFFHRRDLRRARGLRRGQVVSFRLETDSQGLRAVAVAPVSEASP
ncbi:MAG: cold shock domain-containing protein [Caldilineales bacterium]|nr:cold shock domain-containing protein [Caldilineales bacterium]